MKKIVLSSFVAFTLGAVASSASDVKLYQNANGQVFIGYKAVDNKSKLPLYDIRYPTPRIVLI